MKGKDKGSDKNIKTTRRSKKTETANVLQNSDDTFPIVGIGASAGGLEAIELFFKNMPDDCGMAFVVIRHLDPTQEGIMPEMIQRFTGMKVFAATDRLKVEPDSVYVIPSDKSMSILHRTLYLFKPLETRGLRLPIDFFFVSLADDLQEKSIGIILSGMGSDGSLGVRAIKEKSGLVLVQDPAVSKYDSMPRSAINSVPADFIAPPEELPGKLITYLKNKPVIKSEDDLPVKDKSALEKIIILLRMQTGNDFSQYKSNTLYRRIERRMGVHQIDRISKYESFLQNNLKEIEILFKELLIGVTNFFRDAHVWEYLKNDILPDQFSDLPDGYTIRAWIPGCSTGEEAYSLAMIFKEAIDSMKNSKNITIQIFATDIDQGAIEKARKGHYSESITADVSEERLLRFFVKTEDGYKVNTEIRESVVFAPQNVIKDPPFTKLDFLSCRNMLIYFNANLQVKLLTMFQYCLNSKGLLMLGLSETPGNQISLFTSVNTKFRIYRRPVYIKSRKANERNIPSFHENHEKYQKSSRYEIADNIETLADQLLLQSFAPPAVMTNEKGDIIYIAGRTGDYLEPASGKASMNIFAMARKGLRLELSNLYHKAQVSHERFVSRNIKVGTNGTSQLIDVTVQKIENPEQLRGMYMVIFASVTSEQANQKKGKVNSAKQDFDVENIRTELFQAKDDLRHALEEMQISKDELNSINEEMQVTNEELTTSQEEMQSLNEELQTVNIELQSKLDDYTRINNDLKNLLDSTEIATLFIDKNLNIRRFTKEATEVFKLIQTDLGRPFTDIVTELDYPGIADDAMEVLRTLMSNEKTVSTRDGRWFSVRIIPYRTIDDRIDGLVITFNDITLTKNLELALRNTNDEMQVVNRLVEATNEDLKNTERQYRLLFENMTTIFILHEMIYDDNGNAVDYRYLAANPAFEKSTGIPVSSIIGKTAKEIFPDTEQSWIDVFAKVVRTKVPVSYENRWSELNKDFDTWIFHTEKNHFAGIFSDITDRKLAEGMVQNSETRYRRLFESTKDGVLILDAVTGQIVDVNPFLIELIGFTYEELSGKELWEIGVFKNIAASKDAFLELQSKEYIRFEDMPLETKGGNQIDVEFISSLYLADNKKVIQCNIRDITDRKLAEKTVQNLLHEKEVILKEGHHRVKNNMNTIYGLLSLQADDQDNMETKNILLDSAGRVRSMMVLYDKLYRSEVNSSLSLKEYLPSLIEEIVSIFPKKSSVKIETDIEDIVCTARILSSLGIILNELITNSMKYAFSGRNDGCIKVTASMKGNRALIVYKDNGPGIPESVSFENTTGFGMQLIGMLVGQIDGTVEILRDNGTCFVIEFDV
jgi:two-component system CheB/CheR fusion protein